MANEWFDEGAGEPPTRSPAARPADLPGIGVPAEALAGGSAGTMALHQCDNCQAQWPAAELRDVTEHGEREDDDERPSGECPACGALCHPVARIDGLSLGGRADRIGAEMGGAIADRQVVPATEGPCDVPGSERPSAAGVSDPEGMETGPTERSAARP